MWSSSLGPKGAPDLAFSTWETILAEIIVGDAFGADRMDYLLRDSYHAGVAYGRFDHFRLIDTLRILSPPPAGSGKMAALANPSAEAAGGETEQLPSDASREPALGILDGGLHSAEALMLARFFMFTQVYFHPVRRIYDIHLRDFLLQTLPGGKYASTVNAHLEITDNEVTTSIMEASRNPASPGHDPARRISKREHFKLFYQRHPDDLKINLQPGKAVYEAAKAEFGEENVRWDHQPAKGRAPDFPVMPKEGPIASSMAMSDPLTHLPAASFDYVFVHPTLRGNARAWLDANARTFSTPRRITSMERLKRAAIVAHLVTKLRGAGSWCGETHIQKAVYLMQDLFDVPTEYQFILYKHGPFSFDLSDELTSFRGDALLELQPQAPPYGPRYAVTALGKNHCEKFPKTLSKYGDAIQGVAEAIGEQTVGELERLATGIYVTKRQTEQHNGSVKSRARRLNMLKPHVSVEAATEAVEEIDAMIAQRTESDD